MSEPRRFWGTEAASGLALISPTAIYAILLLAAPLAATLLYSVFTDGYLVVEPTFTTKNYVDAWTNPVVQSVMLRSLLVSMLVTAATVILADPVAYFVAGQATQGKPEFTAAWNGATWRFASAANRDRFVAAPTQFAPVYGGYCAFAVSHELVAKGDGKRWKIVDGKLYLNNNWVVHKLWQNDIPGNLSASEKHWPAVSREIAAK
jgi:hypothetical protein